jgi:hypothetical protein
MSDPQIRLHDQCVPLVAAGNTIALNVTQTLVDGTDRLVPTGPQAVKLVVEGPRLRLTPDDLAGVYPAPGSEESPDEFLPHVALKRRTLPWERAGSYAGSPWLALLVFRRSELAFTTAKANENANRPGALVHTTTLSQVETIDTDGAFAWNVLESHGFPTSVLADWVYLTNEQFVRLAPARDDLRFLAHVKRVTEGGATTDHAILVANRLPDAAPFPASDPDAKAEQHVAMLVSLEHRTDLWGDTRKNNPTRHVALLVLHHWTFTPSRGGDFEQVMQAIRYRPNGGALRFGALPEALPAADAPSLSGGFPSLVQPDGVFHDPILHEHAGPVVFRGPLRPFAPAARTNGFAVRAAPEEFDAGADGLLDDYTYATAFELGRLLALADAGILDDLRDLHPLWPLIETPLKENPMPPALQKPDWVSNPAWHEKPWEMPGMPGGEVLEPGGDVLIDVGQIDIGGIEGQVQQWIGTVKSTLDPLATPAAPAVTAIDFQNVSATKLGVQFVAVQIAAQS